MKRVLHEGTTLRQQERGKQAFATSLPKMLHKHADADNCDDAADESNRGLDPASVNHRDSAQGPDRTATTDT
jgi:hypothetical protein